VLGSICLASFSSNKGGFFFVFVMLLLSLDSNYGFFASFSVMARLVLHV
jgi:hypothetical protein